MDPYQAVSFDRLHANHIGLFADHLWSQFQSLIKESSRDVQAAIDTQYVNNLFSRIFDQDLYRMNLFPRWRNLNHYKKVLHIDFDDGSKFEDIAKVC